MSISSVGNPFQDLQEQFRELAQRDWHSPDHLKVWKDKGWVDLIDDHHMDVPHTSKKIYQRLKEQFQAFYLPGFGTHVQRVISKLNSSNYSYPSPKKTQKYIKKIYDFSYRKLILVNAEALMPESTVLFLLPYMAEKKETPLITRIFMTLVNTEGVKKFLLENKAPQDKFYRFLEYLVENNDEKNFTVLFDYIRSCNLMRHYYKNEETIPADVKEKRYFSRLFIKNPFDQTQACLLKQLQDKEYLLTIKPQAKCFRLLIRHQDQVFNLSVRKQQESDPLDEIRLVEEARQYIDRNFNNNYPIAAYSFRCSFTLEQKSELLKNGNYREFAFKRWNYGLQYLSLVTNRFGIQKPCLRGYFNYLKEKNNKIKAYEIEFFIDRLGLEDLDFCSQIFKLGFKKRVYDWIRKALAAHPELISAFNHPNNGLKKDAVITLLKEEQWELALLLLNHGWDLLKAPQGIEGVKKALLKIERLLTVKNSESVRFSKSHVSLITEIVEHIDRVLSPSPSLVKEDSYAALLVQPEMKSNAMRRVVQLRHKTLWVLLKHFMLQDPWKWLSHKGLRNYSDLIFVILHFHSGYIYHIEIQKILASFLRKGWLIPAKKLFELGCSTDPCPSSYPSEKAIN